MKAYRWITLILVLIIIASMVTACAKKEAPGEIIAFTNVSVIPMDKEQALSDQTVIVTDGQISKFGEQLTSKRWIKGRLPL